MASPADAPQSTAVSGGGGIGDPHRSADPHRNNDPRRALETAPMSRLQVGAVAICIALNMIDGFDVLVVAFTSNALASAWNLTGAELGLLLSAGLFGMAGGSLLLAPLADWFGRRALILFCLCVITAGMLLAAFAEGPVQLFWLRVMTGLGIGGMLAGIGVIAAEYSSAKWRSTNVSLQTTGYPIGATLGGWIAALLIARYDWRAAFVFGGLASAAMIPVVLRGLPESLDFLVTRRPVGALGKLNALLRRMGHAEVADLPQREAQEVRSTERPLRGLFAGEALRSTLLIWSSFFLLMFSFYFVMSWTPRLLVAAGLSAEQGITGGVLLNLGGIFGGTCFALLAARVGVRRLTASFLAMSVILTVAFGFLATQFAAAFVVAVALALAIGLFLIGSMAGLYSLAPALYPAPVRTFGVGWAIGIGRLGAVLAPAIAGLLVDAGWSNTQLYCAFAVPMSLAVLTVLGLRMRMVPTNQYGSSSGRMSS